MDIRRVGKTKVGKLNVFDSLLDAVGELGGVGSDPLQLAVGAGGLVVGGNSIERDVVQFLNLVDVRLNLGNVFLDGGDLLLSREKKENARHQINGGLGLVI